MSHAFRFIVIILSAALSRAPAPVSNLAAETYPSGRERCEGYGRPEDSPYVLPFPPGSAYVVQQGNCSSRGDGHRGAARYSYDFDMAVGTPVTAARAGRVLHVEESHFDGQVAPTGFDNYAVVLHEDGTAALYGHFTHEGVSVGEGQNVKAGDPLGRSGNTGNTANLPHLHFSVHSCDPVSKGSVNCPSLPVTFRNAKPAARRLTRGKTYRALPWQSTSPQKKDGAERVRH